jgi:hypothetical protein
MKSPTSPSLPSKSKVFFERLEFRRILSLYEKNVSLGEWRDYAIDSLEDRVIFSVFRRSSENPLYQIEKRKGHRQGPYVVRASNGTVMSQGDDLERVLEVLSPRKLGLVKADWKLV